jgi:hypothetical protein
MALVGRQKSHHRRYGCLSNITRTLKRSAGGFGAVDRKMMNQPLTNRSMLRREFLRELRKPCDVGAQAIARPLAASIRARSAESWGMRKQKITARCGRPALAGCYSSSLCANEKDNTTFARTELVRETAPSKMKTFSTIDKLEDFLWLELPPSFLPY